MIQQIGLYLMSFLYTIAGINHFIKPKFYLAIMPPYIPAHELMVLLSGIAEVVLGIGLLFPLTRALAAWGIILLLLAVLPANVYMITSEKFSTIPHLDFMASFAFAVFTDLVGLYLYAKCSLINHIFLYSIFIFCAKRILLKLNGEN